LAYLALNLFDQSMSSLASPPKFEIADRVGNRITLKSEDGHIAHLFVLEEDVVRVMVLPKGVLRFPRTWAIAPGREDVPPEGRDRFGIAAFSQPPFKFSAGNEAVTIETERARLSVELPGFFCRWEISREGKWHRALKDRPTQAYNFGWWDERVHHYLVRDEDEMYFGLGERSGEMNRAGGRFRMSNVDAMGYSARTSDPLYKHVPFYLTWRPHGHVAYGLFYDTVSDCTFDLGCERSNYHGLYRSFIAEHGDLDYYFIAGPQIADVTRRFTWLTGRPAFLPRWSLGYSGSTMSYTDAPDAEARMREFLAQCEKHDILCDSFHLSSGYGSSGKNRHVFTWNREKFPDPAGFAKSYADQGIHLCPNIKPCLLRDHPLFEEAKAEGLFISDVDGTPGWVQFWGDVGAYLDFTNPKTLAWWKEKVTAQLLAYGLDSTWNDNNEFEIVSDRARMHGFGEVRAAREAKPVQALLMMRASREAQKEFTPAKRPYVVTRSGMPGMQRYAQTWSGDNNTSWETLKYNLKMGLGLGLSGVSNSGHDVGGFAGPKPEPELFVRWVQFGIFMPRFSIHSWNDDGSANEPWMYPKSTAAVRDLIKFRYRLMPYLYHLAWRYHEAFEPIVRPRFYDFPDDPRTFEENDEMMLGPSLLVAPVVQPGQSARAVYLPRGADWQDFWSGDRFAGGTAVTRPAPLNRPVLFAREGHVIPLNIAPQTFLRRAHSLAFMLFPPLSGTFEGTVFEDDGESDAYRTGICTVWSVRAECSEPRVCVHVDWKGRRARTKTPMRVIVPYGRRRTIEVVGRKSYEENFEGLRSAVFEI
jgi:alpha-glucosidase